MKKLLLILFVSALPVIGLSTLGSANNSEWENSGTATRQKQADALSARFNTAGEDLVNQIFSPERNGYASVSSTQAIKAKAELESEPGLTE
jgi:hypothetical protein